MADVLDMTGKVVKQDVRGITPQDVLNEIQSMIEQGRKIQNLACVFVEEQEDGVQYVVRSSDMTINEVHMLHCIAARMKIDLCLGEDDEE